MSDASQPRTVAASCRECGRQLTVDEFRACRGIGHLCADHLAARPRRSGSDSPAGSPGKASHRPRRKREVITFADPDPVRGRLRELQHWISQLNYVNSLRLLDPIRELMRDCQTRREADTGHWTAEHQSMLDRAVSAYEAKMAMLHQAVRTESETARKKQDAGPAEEM